MLQFCSFAGSNSSVSIPFVAITWCQQWTFENKINPTKNSIQPHRFTFSPITSSRRGFNGSAKAQIESIRKVNTWCCQPRSEPIQSQFRNRWYIRQGNVFWRPAFGLPTGKKKKYSVKRMECKCAQDVPLPSFWSNFQSRGDVTV